MDPTKRQSFVKRGDVVDPDRWVEEHGDCLYRYALLRVRRPDVAEDLVQELFAPQSELIARLVEDRLNEAGFAES
jgi:DNA-directed RNA polymerase specialized sigma24 family protein